MTPFENSETLYSKACRGNRQTPELPPTNDFRKRMESRELRVENGKKRVERPFGFSVPAGPR
jgi:hypothetical protein